MGKGGQGEVVVDTSSLAKLLLREEGKERVAEEIKGAKVIVLDFQISEISNVLWKNRTEPEKARELMGLLLVLLDEIIYTLSVWDEAFRISREHNIPFYDAAVIALAKKRNCKLVTSDKWQYEVALRESVDARLVLK